MNKKDILKIAGVKTEKAFYKKYPTEAAFFKAHPEAKNVIQKAQRGRNVPPATRADSLALHNNSLKVLDYYKKSGKYKQQYGYTGSFDYVFDTNDNDYEAFKDYNNNIGVRVPLKSGKSDNVKIPESLYRKNVDKNKYYQRESASAILDTRAPMQLFDRRITPTMYSGFMNNQKGDVMEGDAVALYGYDPLSVKPWDMLTDAEKKLRVEKYGTDGVPKSYLSKTSTKETDKSVDVKPQLQPRVEALNLRPIEQFSFSFPTEEIDTTPRFVEPKSFNISSQRKNMKGVDDYYSYIKDSATYEEALKAKEAAEAYNAEIEKKYGPQNKYRNAKAAKKAAERLEQLKQDVSVEPVYRNGGRANYLQKAQAGTSAVASYVNGMNNVPNMQNIIQGQTQSLGVNAGMFNGPQVDNSVSTITSSQLADDRSGYAFPGGPNSNIEKMNNIANSVSKYAPMVGDLVQGYQSLRAGRKAKKEAQKWAAVTDVQARAAESEDIDNYRMFSENMAKKIKAMMPVNTGEELFPVQGVGTNVLAKNGAEIANTFAPGTIYDDAGYEPLYNSNQVKQFQEGGGVPWGAIGGIGSDIGGSIVGKDGGSQIGGTLGNVAGTLIGGPIGGAVGQTVGTIAGGLLDTNDRDQRKAEAKIKRNQNRMMAAQYRGNIQGQFGSYMEDGGDVPMMEQGGDLNTHWGGYAEPMSYNPYLPDGGETVMFRGQSHEESDGQGNTGIGITFGNSPVEVERGEPAVKLKDGGTGEDNLTVYGNLMIPDYGVEILGDKKAKGRKFKNYIADISKTEAKQNKLIDKSTNELDELDLKTPFDKLKLSSLQANILGGNMKLKDVADKKIKAADIQNAINDTAEEYSLVADDLAKGKIKIDKKAMNMREAMFGTKLTKAQGGDKVVKGRGDKWSYIQAGDTGNPIWDDSKRYDQEWTPTVQKGLIDTERSKKIIDYINNSYGAESDKVKKSLNKFSTDQEKINFLMKEGTNRQVGPIHHVLDAALKYTEPGMTTPLKEEPKKEKTEENKFEIIKNKKNPWLNIGYQTLKGFLDKPYEEALSPDQLMGEYYALSANQVEPVQATPYTPQLRVPYDISRQAAKNDLIAQTRAAQRMAQGNPAAQAIIAAQAYSSMQQLNEQDFIDNQRMKDAVYSGNIATLNDAELKNLAIYDQQYQRQEQAKSNTKAIAQAALSSIGDKLAKHKADVRTYNVYKTLFPQYGFDRSGRGRFEGGYADFNTPQSQYPFYNNPNYALVKNSDGTFTYKLKEQVTEDDQVMENPKTPSMATNPINGNNVMYEDDQYEYIASPIQERNEMLPSKRTGGKIRKNYSQSSIVKAFK